MSNKVKESVEILTEALRNDSDYYYSWQANIAMAFKDEISRSDFEQGDQFPSSEFFHELSNKAAKNFLNMLINL